MEEAGGTGKNGWQNGSDFAIGCGDGFALGSGCSHHPSSREVKSGMALVVSVDNPLLSFVFVRTAYTFFVRSGSGAYFIYSSNR